ncbi:hypothetical protein JL721_9724 [Aureococcus anophagefferens]|nr:hypothetical protein JL721_9724 [Aureococcus anophagefferens]
MALNTLDTDRDGEINMPEWESAIETALANKLEARAADREKKAAAARKEIEEFTAEFLGAARQCFQMIDKDNSGTLTKTEIVKAVAKDKDVVKFLRTCGEENLIPAVPARLEMALNTLDTDRDGEINMPEWESAIETALANKLEARAADREKKAKAAQKEIAEFTAEFLNAARKCFQMIDKDDSGTLTKAEIVKAVAEDKEPARLEKALEVLDTSKDGEVDIDEWEEAIQRGLSKRLEQLADERERRERAARAEDEAFSAEFLNAARQVFLMIDVDNSGSLDKAEVVKAVKTDKKVINFLVNCGNQNLQYLLVPARLEAALQTLDTDRDGEINMPEWESAIETALANKLEARAADREKKAAAARKEIEEFTAEFLNAARQCFQMIDKDNSGTLTKVEIVKAIAEDKDVVKFLRTCGEENLQFLLQPARLAKALDVLDTSKDGEVDIDEWEEAIHRGLAKRLEQLADERERRERAARAEDEAFSAEFLSMAREVFDMIDKDGSGSLDKKEVVTAIRTDKKVISFLQNCGNQNLQYLLVPARLEMALNTLDTDRDGEINAPEWESAIETALANKLEARAAQREAQAKAARKEIEEFTAEFLNAARQCFQMIDKDNSGTLTKTEIVKAVAEDKDVVFLMIDADNSGSLDKAEVVKAVRTDKKVINFLVNCGNQNLQYLLVPARLEMALNTLDTDRDGEINMPEWESAIETALANKLEARAADREKKAKAARKEIEEFTAEFLNAARQCFQMIDKDNSGTLTKAEIVKAVAEDKDVVKFLRTCGEDNLQFLLMPARLEKALQVLDTSKDGEVDIDEWEEAIQRGLAKRLEQLADERERRERAAAAEDEAFSAEFLNAAREVFLMIDKDQSGSLDKAEVVKAVRTDKQVIDFLVNCGNPNLQYLLVPARLEMALNTLDTDRDGEINMPEWESAIETALANKLEARAADREKKAAAARKEIEEFTAEFLGAARQCFQMIDKDNSGTLTKTEIVKAVAEDKDVVKFLRTCGEENLQFLLVPARLQKALEVLDTSKDGEVDVEEWEEAIHRGLAKRLEQLAEERERRERAARAEDEAFSAEFLNAAREVFLMIDKDDSGSLDKAEVVRAVQSDKKVINFLINCGNENLQYLLVPARLEMALNTLDTDRDGEINMPEWESAIETALANKLEARAADREKKAKAAQKEIAEFTAEFLNAARKCFQMIDKDDSGTLTKTEIVKAVAEDKEVVKFLRTCGEENLQFLLQPARLEKALEVLDTSKDGEVDIDEWEEAIQRGLSKRLEQLAVERERRERAARAEDEAFSAEFLNAARQVFLMIDVDNSGSLDKAEVVKAVKTDKKCFQMIDKDNSGTLTKVEIIKAIAEDKDVVKFLRTCGEENLQFLLQPARLEKALDVLDTSKDGEVDIDEWEEAIHRGLAKRLEQLADERERRERAARAEDEAFSAEFLSMAREVFDMIDKDGSGSLDKKEVVTAIRTDKKVISFLQNCGNQNLQYLLVPARLEMALNTLDTDRDGEINAPEWESAIETALANKLEARAAQRELQAKAARKEIEEFTAEFLNAARQCFQMIDKDNSGTLTKVEIIKAIAEDKDVVKFLRTCGEENLQFLLQPARLEKAFDVLDTSKDGEVDIDEWEEAIHRGLAKRLEQLADERERRERAARAEDEAFSAEFLSMAREVFDMIDKDGSGSLDKKEVVTAIRTDKKVISFLQNCGNQNLQYLLVPARLEMALNTLDTDRDGEINAPEWESAIETALANKLEARAAQREAQAKAARKEIEEFTAEFLNAARQCFQMIDKDNSGTLTKTEIVKAVAEDKDVVKFLRTCGEDNLQFLLQPARLEKALQVLDTSKDGEVDIDEWEEAVHRGLAKRLEQLAEERERRDRAARAEDEAFSAEFLNAAREVFIMIDKDDSGSLDKAEVVKAVKTDKKVIDFLVNCGNQNLQYLLVPARLEMALNTLDTDRDGEINMPEWESAIETALANKLEARAADRERKAKAARKEIEEFTAEFLGAARQCFQMIDKDSSGTLTKTEIVKAVAEDKDVVKFLRTCGEENLQFLLVPARLEKALEVLDTSKDGEVDIDEWEEAIHRGLAKRLEQLAEERERRERAARAEDEAFTAQFLNAAREVFLMIDKDDSGSLDKAEVIKAVKTDKKVINFLVNCGNENLQYLLVPARLEMALNTLDTDRDGEINMPEWESAIETALANKLEARAADREAKAKAAQKEIEEFTGTLTKAEIVEAVQSNETVITFLRTCGEPNLQFLLQPRRLQKALEVLDTSKDGEVDVEEWEEAINRGLQTDPEVKGFLETCGEENLQFLLVPARLEKTLQVLDTSKDGEVDVDEWEEAINRGLKVRLAKLAEERDRRERAAAAEDAAFSLEFLSAAREVFDMIDVDESGSLDKHEIVTAVQTDQKVIDFLRTCGNENLQYLLVPARLAQALEDLDTSRDGEIDAAEWEAAIETALANKLKKLGELREEKLLSGGGTGLPLFLFGDLSGGSSFEGTVTKGDHLVPTLNALGVYSGGVGPSDFDHGVQNLERVAASLNFPLLLSNVVEARTGEPLKGTQASRIVHWAGRRIGLIAVSSEKSLADTATVEIATGTGFSTGKGYSAFPRPRRPSFRARDRIPSQAPKCAWNRKPALSSAWAPSCGRKELRLSSVSRPSAAATVRATADQC